MRNLHDKVGQVVWTIFAQKIEEEIRVGRGGGDGDRGQARAAGAEAAVPQLIVDEGVVGVRG